MMASNLDYVVRIVVAFLSVVLFAAVLVAWRRRPTQRMSLVLLAFGIFLIEGIVLVVEVFLQDTSLSTSVSYVFQLAELGILALAILRP